MGSDWSGDTGKYAVENQQLRLTTSNDWGYLIWKDVYFGPEQEVYFRVSQSDPGSDAIDLFLKAQTNVAGTINLIDVWYDPDGHTVEVYTYDYTSGWQSQGSPASLTLATGDRLGAVAMGDGTVMVYQNTQLVLTASVTSWPYYRNGGFIGLGMSSGDRLDDFGGGSASTVGFPVFPEYGLLDDFNRADGPVGGNWAGQTSEFRIYNQQLKWRYNNHAAHLLWNIIQDANQEAYFTLADIDERTSSIDLFLKAQAISGTDIPIIDVWYDPSENALEVCTLDTGEEWDCGDQDVSVTFVEGDVFGAVADENGQVWVFKNDELILKVDKSAWAYSAGDGYIGLGGYEGQLLDDFGGGSSGEMLSFPSPLEYFGGDALNGSGGLSNGQKPDIGPGIDISTRPPHKYDDRGSGDAIWEELISLKKARKQSNPAVPAPTQARTPTPEPNQSETLTPEPLGQGTPSGYGARPDPLASQGQARLASLAPAPSLNVAAWLKVAADFIRNLFSEIRAGMGFGGNREILAGSDLQTTLETLTITYTYDPLRRLTAADYDDGSYFHYEYDAVGNRLSEQTNSGTIAYAYDDANRLAAVGLVDYVWDNNGNLLSDDVYTYTYDHANHLIGVVGEGLEISYVYNGLGERISQTVGSTTTNYTLDLAAGLSQVLEDETYTYLYGVGRIVQYDESDSQYFLGDALGSVRQVVDGDGNVILVKEYKPYGEVLGSTGEGDSSYGFTGEMTDSYIKLIYLRSRMYSPATGRFLTKDSWQGNYTRPLSLKGWNYVEANPINLLDPSGKDPYCSNPFANPLECNPPNIDNYNEKQEPESISWISNVYGDNVSSHLAPIYDKNGQIVYRTNAAQFKISGHEMNCEYEHDENEKIVCKPDSTFNQNFCGQVTISAIVYLFDKSSTARRIVEDMAEKMGIGKRDLTGYSTLKDYMNEYYNQYLYAEEKIVGRDFYEDQLPNYLKNNVISGNLIISAINILQGGSLVGGRVSPNGSIGHWVMITGVSREWNSADHFSPWNWVRIFNPFDNETEYYWWDDFGKSWKQNAGYKMLLVKPLPQKENCDGVTC